jgi:hypothetical protein
LQRIEIASSNEEFERYKIDAGKDIAEANARAVEAQLALERYKAPRQLTPEQQAHISAKIASFGKTPFDVALQPDLEPIGLMRQILSALKQAGWTHVAWKTAGGIQFTIEPDLPGAGILYAEGVHIEFAPSKPEWEPAVTALGTALHAEGIAVKATRASGANAEAIHVVVGRKP